MQACRKCNMHEFNQVLKDKEKIYLYYTDKDGNTFLHVLCS